MFDKPTHIVFAPKYRRKAIYDKIKIDIGQILRKLCKWKGVEIIEAELCPDHVHMLVKIPPKYSVATFMGYLKGKNTKKIAEYIRNQLRQDIEYEQLSLKEFIDPFTGEQVGKNK